MCGRRCLECFLHSHDYGAEKETWGKNTPKNEGYLNSTVGSWGSDD